MKLDLCIYEAQSYTSVPWKPYLLAWLSITTNNKPIFENVSSNAEQKTVTRYQTCYTNLTKGSIHECIWKNQQPPTVFLQAAKNPKYWTVARRYARYRSNTNNKLIFFQKVLAFSDGKQSFKPWPIVLFVVLLLRLDTMCTNCIPLECN